MAEAKFRSMVWRDAQFRAESGILQASQRPAFDLRTSRRRSGHVVAPWSRTLDV